MENNVALVERIVAEQLRPALERESKRIEASVTASVLAFQERIRMDVEHHHSDNLSRFQVQDAALARIEEQTKDYGHDVRALLGEVREWAGKKAGEKAAEERYAETRKGWLSALKWALGLIGSAGSWKWLSDHFHWGSK